MSDTTPQTADGKVLFHFAMSLDGFVAGPGHRMDWTPAVSRFASTGSGAAPANRP